MTICESCRDEKDVTEVEGHLLCEDCAESIIKCDNPKCGKFLAIDYESIIDNFGRSAYPELSLPDHITNMTFCDKKCLMEFLLEDKDT